MVNEIKAGLLVKNINLILLLLIIKRVIE